MRSLARHRPSHRGHLRKLETDPASRSTAPRLDAIVMPTTRRLDEPRSGVLLAAQLAREFGQEQEAPTVVLLCSGAARSEHLPRDAFGPTEVLTIDVPAAREQPWPRLRTDNHELSTFRRRNDVGLKRNLGLVLARSQGWRHVLMLDDDINRLHAEGNREQHLGVMNMVDALTALGEQDSRCVGWLSEEFPDNSVVCHARRQMGLRQDKFIGGDALLMRCDGPDLPFFPGVYNEDWMFLLPFLLTERGRGRSLVEGGLVAQDPYTVFAEKRAAAEELGDVLGEGLFNLLTLPPNRFWELSTSYEYWDLVIQERRAMIRELIGRTRTLPLIESALRAADHVHDEREGGWSFPLATYCRQWDHDLRVWHDFLPTVRKDQPEALGFRRHRGGR